MLAKSSLIYCPTPSYDPFTLMTESKISHNSKLVGRPSDKVRVVILQAGVQVSRHAEGPGTAEVENPHR